MLDYPLVALDFMNRDHAEFVDLRGKLLGLLTAQAPETEVDRLLDELLEYTRRHFAEEERLMLETQFPAYHRHKGEHDNVLTNMSAQIEQWKQGCNTETLRAWLDGVVGDWFVNHVNTMDFVTAGFIEMKQKAG
jgi:hemerythrin